MASANEKYSVFFVIVVYPTVTVYSLHFSA